MTEASETVVDPVCGMKVHPQKAAGSFQHDGTTYFFCGKSCLAKFSADPDKYLRAEAHEAMDAPVARVQLGTRGSWKRPANPAARYVCPMDPEVASDRPGACPKCGMALEPETISSAEPENHELIDMTRRFRVAAALTVPVFVIAMSEMLPGDPVRALLSMKAQGFAELVLSTPVVLWAGWPFFERMWASFRNRSLNMFTLIGIGTGAAYVFSLIATLFPSLFPASFRGHHGEVNRYFESAS